MLIHQDGLGGDTWILFYLSHYSPLASNNILFHRVELIIILWTVATGTPKHLEMVLKPFPDL